MGERLPSPFAVSKETGHEIKTYTYRSAEGAAICDVRLELEESARHGAAEDGGTRRAVKRVVLLKRDGNMERSVDLFDFLDRHAGTDANGKALMASGEVLVTPTGRVDYHYRNISDDVFVPTLEYATDIAVMLHELGHRDQSREDFFIAKKGSRALYMVSLDKDIGASELERAAGSVERYAQAAAALLPPDDYRMMEDARAAAWEKMQTIESLSFFLAPALGRAGIDFGSEEVPMALPRTIAGLERLGFIRHDPGAAGDGPRASLDSGELERMAASSDFLQGLKRGLRSMGLEMVPMFGGSVLVRIPVDVDGVCRFVDIALAPAAVGRDTFAFFQEQARKLRVYQERLDVGGLRWRDVSPEVRERLASIEKTVAEIAERDAWVRAIGWLRKLRDEEGIDLLKDLPGLGSIQALLHGSVPDRTGVRQEIATCLETYGATTPEMKRKYGKIPRVKRSRPEAAVHSEAGTLKATIAALKERIRRI